jgi:hypothetical protein
MGGPDPVAGRAGGVRSECRSVELSARETELPSVPSRNFEHFRFYRVFARLPKEAVDQSELFTTRKLRP